MPPQIAHWIASASAAALLLAACQPAPPDRAAASRAPAVPAAAPSKAAPSPPKAPSAAVAMPSMQLPAGPIYACDIAGARRQSNFGQRRVALCRRHRRWARASTGAMRAGVAAARYHAQTASERRRRRAEYDRSVRRVTFSRGRSAREEEVMRAEPLRGARREGVAFPHVTARKAGLEPAQPLRRHAVRERIRHDIPLRALLDLVVADGGGGGETFLDVSWTELVALLREISPHARVAICLQLESYRQRIGATLVRPLSRRVEPPHHAGQVLHVVANLVRDHVSLGEIAGGPEAARELVEKRGVEVELAVTGTMENDPAAAADRTPSAPSAEQNERRRLVGAPIVLNTAPHTSSVSLARGPGVADRWRSRRCAPGGTLSRCGP
jgi:hypothetical protein